MILGYFHIKVSASRLSRWRPWAIAAVLILSSSNAAAQTLQCPNVEVPPADQLNRHTNIALEALEQTFDSYNLSVDLDVLVRKRDAILEEYYYTEQKLFVEVLCAKYCQILSQSEHSSKEEALDTAEKELCTRVEFAPLIADSRDPKYLTATPGSLATFGFAHYKPSAFPVWKVASVDESEESNKSTETAPGNKENYLREAPFVVNQANKHFVVVASASSRDGAISEMKRLKLKAPQYDFVVYAPYGSNPNYAIMMATWAPMEIAKEALNNAQQDVAPDAFIWSCRSEGSSC